MANKNDIQNALKFKEKSQQPYTSCLISEPNTKSKTLAASLNNAHGSKMRDSFAQRRVTVRELINNYQDLFLSDVIWPQLIMYALTSSVLHPSLSRTA